MHKHHTAPLPITTIIITPVIPIHSKSDYLEQTLAGTNEPMSTLMRLTMSNMYPYSRGGANGTSGGVDDEGRANWLWVHFLLVVLYCSYAMWLLDGESHRLRWD